jgi:hypothetical protein
MSRTRHKDKENNQQGSRRFDRSCRNHGSCNWCARGRQHTNGKRAPALEPMPFIPKLRNPKWKRK